jgi:uncharacterized small protein (DUF1192 family)
VSQLYGEAAMIVECVKENEDGSADVILRDIDERMLQLLIQEGLIALLTKEIARLEKEKKIPALLKKEPTNEV